MYQVLDMKKDKEQDNNPEFRVEFAQELIEEIVKSNCKGYDFFLLGPGRCKRNTEYLTLKCWLRT